jgi:hypothetical protein
LIALTIVTGLVGLWTFVTGRPLLGVPHWPVSGRALRVLGAVTVAECLLVLILAVTRGDGIAFVTYAMGSLAVAFAVQFARRQQPNT